MIDEIIEIDCQVCFGWSTLISPMFTRLGRFMSVIYEYKSKILKLLMLQIICKSKSYFWHRFKNENLFFHFQTHKAPTIPKLGARALKLSRHLPGDKIKKLTYHSPDLGLRNFFMQFWNSSPTQIHKKMGPRISKMT